MSKKLAVMAVTLTVLTGCADAFRGHQDVVARAAGQELTVDRLAVMIGPAKTVPLRREIVDRVAEMWVDYQLLAQTVASGDSLMDSATVDQANWPVIAQLLANRLHDSLIVSRARPTAAQVESVYGGTEYRYLYHILLETREDTSATAVAAKRRRMDGVLARLRAGAQFQDLARQVSDDPGSKPLGGQLGLTGRGGFIRAFEDAGFALEPGATSGIVQTAYGLHVIWRPRLAEVRDSFAADLEEIMVGRLDSLYLDSLTNKTNIRVRGSATAIVRRVAEDLRAAKTRSRVLATFRGGRLRESDFAQWLQAFGQQTRGMVMQAPDSTLIEFVKSIARNEMLLTGARENGITLSAADRDSIRLLYRRDLVTMLDGIGISADSLAADSSGRGQDRPALAARHVDAYFAAITNTPAARRYYEVPPFLADVLRERSRWTIYPAGVERALERARELRGPEPPPGGAPGMPQMTPAPVRPAPGGPPVGGPPDARKSN